MPKKAAPQKGDKKAKSKEDLIEIALRLAVELGWEHVRMQDIAQEAGLSLAELHEHFEDKCDVLCAFGRVVDRKVLESVGEPDESLSPRDRLFDIMMERFDILNDYRDGVIAIICSFKSDPKEAVISAPHLCRSMSWMMEAAGLDTTGIRGALKLAGLSALYLDVLRVWVKDDSPDMAKTMAALDKDLGRAEQCANTFGF